jgi:hypothetical protein
VAPIFQYSTAVISAASNLTPASAIDCGNDELSVQQVQQAGVGAWTVYSKSRDVPDKR